MENNLSNKVLIVIRGGTVEMVFCSDQYLEVDILDYDNEEFLNDTEAKSELENRAGELKAIY